MTKQELQAKHDSEVRLAIATELEHLTDEDMNADDSSERILVRLMAGARAAQNAHALLSREKADDAGEDDDWFLHFQLDDAVASVLWWFTHAREDLDLDDVGLPCKGSSSLSAFGNFVYLCRLKMSYESEVDLLTDNFREDLQTTIRDGVTTLPVL